MISFRIGEEFKITYGENAILSNERSSDEYFEIQLKNLSRIKPPKSPDRFIIFLRITSGKDKSNIDDLSMDGEFRFPSTAFKLNWKNFVITIHDIDYLAAYALLQVD